MKRKGHAAKGHTSKHVGTSKHHATSKHHPKRQVKAVGHGVIGGGSGGAAHVKAKHPHHARGLAIGDWLPVCSVEALAQSLRLFGGVAVSDEDVERVHTLAGGSEIAPVSILAALEAASAFGLAGCRPVVWSGREDLKAVIKPVREAEDGVVGGNLVVDLCAAVPRARASHALILGVDLPGPHAVLATPDGWWSWGELYSPWTTAVSEAWVVSWQ